MASPAGAAGRAVKRRGERGGKRSGRHGTGGWRAPAARARFRAPTDPRTRIIPVTGISPGTGISLGIEAATRVNARVTAHVCAGDAEGARPVVVRVRAPAAAWNGPTGHSQVQTRLLGGAMPLVGGVAALSRPRIQADVLARPSAMRQPGIQACVLARAGATTPPRVYACVLARVAATRWPGVMAGARVTADRGTARAWRAVRPRVTVRARVAVRTRATVQARTTVQ